jgi:hypothetical protein
MHESTTVVIGCTDCHGGNAAASATGAAPGSAAYTEAQHAAHVQPNHPEAWADPKRPDRISSANPVRSYTLLNRESPAFIRFVNPGDLRVSEQSCGGCHTRETHRVERSLMTTTAMLWVARRTTTASST